MDSNQLNKQTSTKEGTGNGAHPLDGYTKQPQQSGGQQEKSPYYQSQAPTIELPKGGGAISGIDEKFEVNAVNGTSSVSIPLPLSAGRGKFTPNLALSYSSGGGNSTFGLGFGLSLAGIQRKTDKGLPQYKDATDSDTFILAGAEDLVPIVDPNGEPIFVSNSEGYQVKRYQPRIEGLFARIEYITGTTDSWWRVTTKDNIVTYYGLTAAGRIADPNDPQKVFKWLPQLICDHKGNVQLYEYVSENMDNVVMDVHEQNRTALSVSANKYLKRVKYCNHQPYTIDDQTVFAPDIANMGIDYLMEAVLDYGDHEGYDIEPSATQKWACRKDAFSDFHAGFEIRTYRLCQRVMMFHYFKELNNGVEAAPTIVRSLELTYKNESASDYVEADHILSALQSSYRADGNGGYYKRSLPAMTFDYQELQWDTTIQSVSPDNLMNVPQGLTGNYQWIDLWGEGISGILTEQATGWHYKSNEGDGSFSPGQPVAEKPSLSGLGSNLQWQDLDADGRRQVVSRTPMLNGFYELNDDQEWESFRAFEQQINVDWNSPYTKMLDLNGDGRPDLLMTEDQVWTWYQNEGKGGFTTGGRAATYFDEEEGPVLLVSDTIQCVFLADMNGDGMTDLVRIKNGSICYWPNMGYGKFGAKVTMLNAPVFDHYDTYNPQYLNLVDVSGTGAPDIMYLGANTCKVWINLSGNAWSAAQEINTLPQIDAYAKVATLDFLGNGTGCLVWSSPLPQHAHAPMRYIDLMSGHKPYLLKSYHNGMGKTVTVNYKSSTHYYLKAKAAGTPWATRLPFPVHLVSEVITADAVSETSYTQSYSYYHGYYDHEEREFRGFGRVDVVDSESAVFFDNATTPIENDLDQAPVHTKTWYHTGAYLREQTLLDAFEQEYFSFSGFEEIQQAKLPSGLTGVEYREAHRALKGVPLRQEVYAVDGTPMEDKPYTVTTYAYCTELKQSKYDNRYASFYTYQEQQLVYHCERNEQDVRLMQQLTLNVDQWGNVTESASIAYPRANTAGLPTVVATEQQKMWVAYNTVSFTNDIISSNQYYRLRLPYEQQSYEVHNLTIPSGLWTVESLTTAISSASQIDFSEEHGTGIKKRLIAGQRSLFRSDDLSCVLSLGVIEALAFPHEAYQLGLTDAVINGSYGSRLTATILAEAGYLKENDIIKFNSSLTNHYWLPSGTMVFGINPQNRFYMPEAFVDPWGNQATISYWEDYYLLPKTITDAKNNITTVNSYDWRCLQPTAITDPNDNVSEVLYDTLCFPVAAAIKGKVGTQVVDINGNNVIVELTEADYLTYIETDNSRTSLDPEDNVDLANQGSFWDDPKAYASDLLKRATWRTVYDFDTSDGGAVRVAMIGREEHWEDNDNSPLQVRISYSDGFGRVAMHKTQAADDPFTQSERWIGSGKTVYNNKGKEVLQYEPYYSTDFGYDTAQQIAAAEQSVSPRMFYDPLGRPYRTEMPDGSYSQVAWDAWQQATYDNNDTVLDSDWYTAQSAGSAEEQDAAAKALVHDDTPTVVHLDTLARPFYTIQKNAWYDNAAMSIVTEDLESYVTMDIEGNKLAVHDARGLTPLTYQYSQIKAVTGQYSIDSGQQYILVDAAGQPLYAWDADDRFFEFEYDALRRPTAKRVTPSGGSTTTLEVFTYGEEETDPHLLNLRGQLYQHKDGAGTVTVAGYDFKGMPTSSTRQYVADATTRPDWAGTPTMETDSYITATTTDALGRPQTITNKTDDGTTVTTNGNTNYTYEEAGMLYSVDIDGVGTLDKDIINKIEYNAKGQRTEVQYQHTGLTSTTKYTYDDKTFRVTNIRTTKSNAPNDAVQDLQYWYDPVGNITLQRDASLQTVFFANSIVKPENDYTYNALYRLVEASGRQHEGMGASPEPSSQNDYYRVGKAYKADETKMRNYTQYYTYDEVGNMTKMKHSIPSTTSLSWTRTFDMDVANNRMLQSETGSALQPEYYDYDKRGNMMGGMSHILYFDYNDENHLAHITLQDGREVYYQYDGSGQRIRKQVVNGNTVEARKYLGNYELYVKTIGGTVNTERESLHVNDDSTRVALIDTPITTPNSEEQVIRYQYTDHLGTASLELDYATAAVITYEEYFPFGSTSFQSVNTSRTLSMKRYRYTGKERDEESGLYYHGARYYIPWLCRWTASDPLESKYAGWSPYHYVKCNPINDTDSTGMGGDKDGVTVSDKPWLFKGDLNSTYMQSRGHGVWYKDSKGYTQFTLGASDKSSFEKTDAAKSGGEYQFESSSISTPDYYASFNNQGMLFLYGRNADGSYNDTPYKVKDRLTGDAWEFDNEGNMISGISRNNLASGNKSSLDDDTKIAASNSSNTIEKSPSKEVQSSATDVPKTKIDKSIDVINSVSLITSASSATISRGAYLARNYSSPAKITMRVPQTLNWQSSKRLTYRNTPFTLGKWSPSMAKSVNSWMKPIGKTATIAAPLTAAYSILKDGKLTIGDGYEAAVTGFGIAFPVFGLLYGALDLGFSLFSHKSLTDRVKETIDEQFNYNINIK